MSNSIVKVKPLEWEELEPDWWASDVDRLHLAYEVRTSKSGVRCRFNSRSFEHFDGTADEAKEAAQLDFEQRVFSVIEIRKDEEA